MKGKPEVKTDLTKQELMRIFEEQIELKDAENKKLQDEKEGLEHRLDMLTRRYNHKRRKIEALEGRLEAIQTPEILEKLAELEHNQWMEWSKAIAPEINIGCYSAHLKRWNEWWVPYSRLTEEVKEYDRVWARKALGVLLQPTLLPKRLDQKTPILKDIASMPNFDKKVKDGLHSVSEGKIFWTPENKVTCREHGACNAVNKACTIWRCLACHEGCFVVWQEEWQLEYDKLRGKEGEHK